MNKYIKWSLILLGAYAGWDLVKSAYHLGFDEGREAGYDEGREAGYDEGHDHLLSVMKMSPTFKEAAERIEGNTFEQDKIEGSYLNVGGLGL